MQVTKAVVNAELVAGNISYLTYTGEVLTPTFTFYTQVDAKDVEVEVPADAYVATHVNEDGDEVELKDVDKYTATFEAAKDVVNYEFTKGCEAKFEVTDKKVFLDVPANEWYSQAVYTAAANGYMNGDGAGKTFSPMRELTRAEAACVLFNMAGGDALYGNLPGLQRVHRHLRDRLLRRDRQRVLRQGRGLGRADRRHQRLPPTAPSASPAR